MKIMKYLNQLICLLVLVNFDALSQKPDKEEWLQLFNGKDLTGWDIKINGHELNDNFANTFTVEEGRLKVNYEGYQTFTNQFGHIYYNQPFSYYKIRIEYRFVGEQLTGGATWNVRNSGVMLHSQSAQSLTKDQLFPVCLEFQLLGGLGKEPRPTGNLCTPGSYVEMNGKVDMTHCFNSSSKTYDGDQWVKAEAIVLGDSVIYHLIEGDTVLQYQHPKIGEEDTQMRAYLLPGDWLKKAGTPLREGYIALQAESQPVHFRKVELLNLKGCMNPKCAKYKSYHVVQGECECQRKRNNLKKKQAH
jgi:hypothetical protein